MKILQSIARKLGFQPAVRQTRRPANINMMERYAAAQNGRLNLDFLGASTGTADEKLRYQLEVLRNRSRQLERDDPLTGNWLRLLGNNVLGAKGLKLDGKITEPERLGPNGNVIPGAPDEMANKAIEQAWSRWGGSHYDPQHGQNSHASLCGRHSWRKLCRLALRSAKRDGEVLGLIHMPDGNPFGFAIELREADNLDTRLNEDVYAGGQRVGTIRMGIEYDLNNRPIAYHLFRWHPGDRLHRAAADLTERERWPASRVIHLFNPKRISQGRGVPDNHAAMNDTMMLDGYNEAALVAARAGACQGGFFRKQNPDGIQMDEDSDGIGIYQLEPGQWQELPMGVDPVTVNPNYPHTNFTDFVKTIARRISNALGVSYFSLAGDLEAVNFSSARAGVLEDREEYMDVQEWFIEDWATPIFQAWLRSALLAGQITLSNGSPLSFSKYDKFRQCQFTGRRWSWVTPTQDIAATEKSIALGLTSRRREAAKQGVDIAEVAAEQQADQELFAKHGVTIAADKPAPQAPESPPPAAPQSPPEQQKK